jgi:hypothetical protein
MKNMLLPVFGLLLLTGCARLDVYPVDDYGVRGESDGILYYLPRPVLIVAADLSCRIEYIPDFSRRYIIDTSNAGSFERSITLENGWCFVGLTEKGGEPVGDLIDSLSGAGGKLFSMIRGGGGGAGGGVDRTMGPQPGVYLFDYTGGEVTLVPLFPVDTR